MQRAARFVERALAPPIVALLALAAALPSLAGGIQGEDWVLRDLAQRRPFPTDLWDPTPDLEGAPLRALNAGLRDLGLLPWVAADDFRVGFFRPLSSLLHRLDFALGRDTPALWHAHSLLWFAALLVVAHRSIAALSGPGTVTARVAFAIFALHHAHGQAVGWVANRSALIAASFGLLAWLFQARADETRRGGLALLAALALGVALSAGELGLSAVGLLVAQLLVRAPPERRWRAPWCIVVIVYAAYYISGGFGVTRSELYLAPQRLAPGDLIELGRRGLALGAGGLGLPSDAWNDAPRPLVLVLLGATLALLGLVGAAAWRRRAESSALRWAVLALPLSLVPCLAVFPEDRVLTVVTLPASVLLGALLTPASAAVLPIGRALGLAAALALSTVIFGWRVGTMERYEARLAAARQVVYGNAADGDLIVLLGASDYHFASMIVATESARRGRPVRTLTLHGAERGASFTRRDAQRLHLVATPGVLDRTLSRGFRSRDQRPRSGDVILLQAVRLSVLEIDPRTGPTSIDVTFGAPLDAPSLRWFVPESGAFRAISPPAIGETRSLSGRP